MKAKEMTIKALEEYCNKRNGTCEDCPLCVAHSNEILVDHTCYIEIRKIEEKEI